MYHLVFSFGCGTRNYPEGEEKHFIHVSVSYNDQMYSYTIIINGREPSIDKVNSRVNDVLIETEKLFDTCENEYDYFKLSNLVLSSYMLLYGFRMLPQMLDIMVDNIDWLQKFQQRTVNKHDC